MLDVGDPTDPAEGDTGRRHRRRAIEGLQETIPTFGHGQNDLRVVSGNLPNGVAPEVMVETWMRQKIAAAYQDWQVDFLRLQREGGWEDHNRELQAKLLESIGGLPERTPLNARVTGVIERPGFTVEKILFESRPGMRRLVRIAQLCVQRDELCGVLVGQPVVVIDFGL